MTRPGGGAAPDDVQAAVDRLAAARDVVVLGHVQPDADALGSALALGLALQERGVPVAVSFGEPDEVPASLAGLPGQHLVTPADRVPSRPDLLVTVDVSSVDRLGRLAGLVQRAGHVLVVDHHPTNTRFGTTHLVDARAESTTVLVADVLDRWGVGLTPAIAANLYAGLATDSVGFRFARAGGHRLAARLLEAGVQPDQLLRPITDSHPVGWLAMLSTVLGRSRTAAVRPGVELTWTWVGTGDRAGIRSEEADSVIDIVRTTAPFAAVLKESDPGVWQVSLRSTDEVDVAGIATALGGGGHRRAAGFAFRGTPEAAVAEMIELANR